MKNKYTDSEIVSYLLYGAFDKSISHDVKVLMELGFVDLRKIRIHLKRSLKIINERSKNPLLVAAGRKGGIALVKKMPPGYMKELGRKNKNSIDTPSKE